MAFSNSKSTEVSRSTFNDIGRDQIIIQFNISLFGPRQPPPGRVHHEESKALAWPGPSPVTLSPSAPVSPSTFPESISVLDITADLIVQIVDLLIMPRQPTDNHSDLRLEMKTLHQSIILTRRAIQEYENRPLGQSLIHAVTLEVDRCRVILQDVFDTVNGTWHGLNPTSIRNFWRPVWWGRWDGDEMALLRDQLSDSRKTLHGFLMALNSYVVFGCSHGVLTETS